MYLQNPACTFCCPPMLWAGHASYITGLATCFSETVAYNSYPCTDCAGSLKHQRLRTDSRFRDADGNRAPMPHQTRRTMPNRSPPAESGVPQPSTATQPPHDQEMQRRSGLPGCAAGEVADPAFEPPSSEKPRHSRQKHSLLSRLFPVTNFAVQDLIAKAMTSL